MVDKVDKVKARFIDYAQQLLKARSGPAFFGAAPVSFIPLDPQEITERVDQAMNKLSLNEKQKQLLKKVITEWLGSIEGKAHSNQASDLVNFTQQGLATVPGYRPPESEAQQKLKR